MVPALQVVNTELQTLRSIRSGLPTFEPVVSVPQTSLNPSGDHLSVAATVGSNVVQPGNFDLDDCELFSTKRPHQLMVS